MITLGNNALAAKDFLSTVTSAQKNSALTAIAKALRENSDYIIEENKKDLVLKPMGDNALGYLLRMNKLLEKEIMFKA